MQSKHPRGQPRRDPNSAKRIALSWRVTPEFKAKLDAQAARTGRSLAAECERLIELGMIFEMLIALGQQRLFEEWAKERGSAPE